MVDWQITATTVYCDAVDDEVTILVSRDFSTKCTGHSKYSKPDKNVLKELRKKSGKLKRQLGCAGPECPRVTGYKAKLLAEETAK